MISSEEANWLHSIIDILVSTLGATPHEESIQKIYFGIPYKLAESTSKEDYHKYYEPRVVSLGPFHYRLTHVAPMENFKRKAVMELLLESLNEDCSSDEELASVEKVYRSVEQDILSARDRYDMSCRDTISDSEWCQMMFRDGCFIIYFITSTGKKSWLKKRNRDLVWRDIILLENQFPLQVLSALVRAFKCEKSPFQVPAPPILDNYIYIHKVFLLHRRQQGEAPDSVHLLEYYRNLWINVLFKDDIEEEEDDDKKEEDGPPFSVTELKKVGIRCSCAISHYDKVIHFKSSMLSGKLFLPQLIIDELNMTLLYNLVAYESSCNLEYTSFGFSSYLNFMSMLINGEEDVKELQAREVIQLNLKFSDEQVVNFFKDIVAHHDPNPQGFKDVKRQISTYFKSKNLLPLRVGYAEFKQRYFSGPWSFLVFLAVILTVSMTIIQIVFTGIQTYKKD
ncbi:hypothetical protein R3W88_011388 [Solanum pinnatisectum]|uniref:Uncharacterized protein n=1 Tax=Solanum pinnatisectum TaxID=50273 RepID=A0AAV9L8H0_9SOLN|nr:hypothetical protein R3W88_011388 [Solanum pinnatisectum]